MLQTIDYAVSRLSVLASVNVRHSCCLRCSKRSRPLGLRFDDGRQIILLLLAVLNPLILEDSGIAEIPHPALPPWIDFGAWSPLSSRAAPWPEHTQPPATAPLVFCCPCSRRSNRISPTTVVKLTISTRAENCTALITPAARAVLANTNPGRPRGINP